MPVYLDHHATTPMDPRVLDTMMPYLTSKFGNAASHNHVFGWEAEEAVRVARGQMAALIGALDREIIFTSGATEANNLAIKGVAEMYAGKGRHIITAAAEHKCVLDTCRQLMKKGLEVTFLPVNADGSVDPEAVRSAITEKTILISVMLANNEIGTINDAEAIGRIAHERGVIFHSDCSQALGKIPVDVQALSIDLASFSAHKFYGPKGVGALYVRSKDPRVKLMPQINGGGHESGMRSGTLNVPGIVGMGKAAALCAEDFERDFWHYAELRNALYHRLKDGLYILGLNGPEIGELEKMKACGSAEQAARHLKRLPNNLNVHFGRIDGAALISSLKDIAVSSGSACTSASPEPSHVLQAIGLDAESARSSIRFGIGRFNTLDEIAYAADRIIGLVRQLRGLPADGATPVTETGKTASGIFPECGCPS